MKILVHMGHPGHFHLFKNAIRELEKKGHNIIITAFKKDVLIELLDLNGFSYQIIGAKKKGIVKKIINAFKVYLKLIKIISKFKPDLTLSIGSPYVAPIAKLFGAKNIAFNDTEHAKEQRMLYLPFTDIIATPVPYRLDLGKKQVRYQGYHELAYLHPNWFKPDPGIIKQLGIKQKEKFAIIRFISWEASHDVGRKGFSAVDKYKLITELEKFVTPMITSENRLPDRIERFQIKVPPHKIHDAMFYAAMVISEGGTTATEAALLGTPAIHINPLAKESGNHLELQEKYEIKFFYPTLIEAEPKIIELLKKEGLKKEWAILRQKLLKDKIDVTDWMIKLIENQ